MKSAFSAAILLTVLIFVSGRLDWWRAWLYVALVIGVQTATSVLLLRRNPDLLRERSRLQPGTKPWDKVLAPIIAIFGPVAIWCVAAWDVRTQWPPAVGPLLSAAALAVCLAGALLVLRAMLANSFFAATVRLQTDRNQVVVQHGPYGVVRHPGYTGAFVFTMASPLALGSWLALIPASLTCAMLLLRTMLEDATLRAELPGYADYARQVRWRLVPRVW